MRLQRCKMIEKSRIKAIALNSGFKLKEQTDGNQHFENFEVIVNKDSLEDFNV